MSLLLAAPLSAWADALRPVDLRVDGGEDNWSPSRLFSLRWTNPPDPVAAVHYRVLDPSGGIAIGETTLPWPATSIQHVSVPPTPGAYTAEVWLEGASGGVGAPVTAKLRFDDAWPGRIEPPPADDWLGRGSFPYTLSLGSPPAPQPLSGIRGYAASIDRFPTGSPCANTGLCTTAETALSGGAGQNTLTIWRLPEGTSYLHTVAVSGSGVPSAVPGNTILRVDETDPVTRLAGVPGGWSSDPLTLRATATDAASGMDATADGPIPFTAIRVDGGVPTVAASDNVLATIIASGVHTVAYYARDAAGNVDDGGMANGRPNRDPALALVRIDRDPPRLAFVGAQDPADPERIEARGSDTLSGLDRSRGSIAARQVGSGKRFVPLPTEISNGLLSARWDSAAAPAGEYEFRATAYDAAGNQVSTLSRGDGRPMRLQGPLKASERLEASLDSPGTVGYGEAASLEGRLLAGRRAPLEGRPLKVIERFDDGASERERVSTVTTDRGGKFRLRLAPGPSRLVFAVAAPTATMRGASSVPLRVAVRGRIRMRASATAAKVGGRPIVFEGRVAAGGAVLPREGKIVQLQFRVPGLPWREFRTVRTDARGRFRYAYRFADDDSRGVRFQFRAFAPAQAGWPFEPAGSRPVTVRGV